MVTEGRMDGDAIGISVPGDWSIVECEVFVMLAGLRALPGSYAGAVIVFSDCIPAIQIIQSMLPDGDTAGVWEVFVETTHTLSRVEFVWIPGH